MSDSTCPAADLLIERLSQYGVVEVFGYPGGQLTPLYDALYRTPSIRHRLARHEQASTFMADGYARATGRTGVCLAVCGPGVYNAATPLASAHTDSIPLLLISGQVPRSGAGLRSGYYHENDQLAACRHFTKAQVRIETSADLLAGVDHAWQQTIEGRPGPVLLEVPLDVLREEVPRLPLPPLPPPPQRPEPTPAVAGQVAEIISGWKRPLILAGGGVVTSGGERALAKLAERLGAPVYHTANGKCALAANHPLAAGMPWTQATSDLTQMADFFSPLWSKADGVLIVGCRLTQLATGSWSLPFPTSRVHIDIDPEEIGRHLDLAGPRSLGVVADARRCLEWLLELLAGEDQPAWTALPARTDTWRLPGIDVQGVLRQVLSPDTIVAADVTRLAYILMADYPLTRPRTWLHPAGAVAMGYAIPAALGAKAAYPDRPVLAVVGDGGFQMSALELASAIQEGLPIVVLLINDNCLTLIKATQLRRYEGRCIGVDLRNPDFGMLTGAFGVGYWKATDERSLESSLTEAFAAGVPALVEVRI